MFKDELKNELKVIFTSNQEIDQKIVDIKIAIHNLEKLGMDVKQLYNLLDNIGIEFKKFKDYSTDYTKEKIN